MPGVRHQDEPDAGKEGVSPRAATRGRWGPRVPWAGDPAGNRRRGPGPDVLAGDPRLPQEPGRLRQAGRDADGRGHGGRRPARRTPTWSWSTPARSSSRPARSRSTRSSPSTTSAGPGARLVVTGCMAERYGAELAEALPEVDAVAGFGVPVTLGAGRPRGRGRAVDVARLDLLNLPRPQVGGAVGLRQGGRGVRPHVRVLRHPVVPGQAAVAVGGVDPRRGRPRWRRPRSSWWPRTWRPTAATSAARGRSSPWWRRWRPGSRRVRLLYLYPSELDDRLVDAICATGVPYFDLSLQHVSKPLLRRMRRWGDGERFLRRIASIREREPEAAFRSSFIVGYPGETEDDHDLLLAVPRGRPARLGRLLRLLGRGRHLRRRPRRDGRRRRWWPSGCGSWASCRTRITLARRDGAGGLDDRGPGRRAGRRPQPPGGARDRRRGEPDRRPRRRVRSRP